MILPFRRKQQFVVVVHRPRGFEAYGPFSSRTAAEQYASEQSPASFPSVLAEVVPIRKP